MGLATPTKSFECEITDGLAHIVLNRPDKGNPVDGEFSREFSLGMAEISERNDVRAVLLSARGKMFSVGGDLAALAGAGTALPATIKTWTADWHAGIVRMVRMRAPVVAAVHGHVAGGSVSLMAAADLVVIGKSARITSAFARIGFSPDSGSTTTLTARMGAMRARRFFLMNETLDANAALSAGLVDFVVDDDAVSRKRRASRVSSRPGRPKPMAASSGCSCRPRTARWKASSRTRRKPWPPSPEPPMRGKGSGRSRKNASRCFPGDRTVRQVGLCRPSMRKDGDAADRLFDAVNSAAILRKRNPGAFNLPGAGFAT